MSRGTMSERTLQEAVLELARLNGWWAYHTFDSRRSQAGFPDLVLIRPPRLVFVELKSQRGRMSREQEHVLNDLLGRVQGVEVYLWTPEHWFSGLVEQVLGRRVIHKEVAG